jgi:tetratricopeptide (TPR) repeat protein
MMKTSLRNALAILAPAVLLLGCAAAKLHRDGLAAIDRGNYEVGVSQLNQAVERDPGNMTYKLDLATRRDASIQHLISTADALRTAGQLDAAAET